jgi:putative ABC transport system permease protein
MSATTQLIPTRLRLGDMARVASVGLRTRRLRAALSALGIAIGVAAIVAVLGLSSSSQAGLLAEIDRLGTNLLVVTNGQTVTGQAATLPLTAPAMIGRINPVTQVADTAEISVNVFRSPLIPSIDTNALSVDAASLTLLPAVGTSVAQGSYLNAATSTEPAVVLGATAAQRLGIDHIYPHERIWLGGMWFYVTGILKPAALAPEIDSSALIGYPAAKRYLGYTSTAANGKTIDGPPTTIYVRAHNSQVNAVDNVLANTADPENRSDVDVSQPSAALTARADAQGAFNGLFLGLGAVALLVGAVGVANIMIISVLERRSEIGLRRALGATRSQIRAQFLSEAILLALLGGAVGVVAGALATTVYAHTKHWAVVIPTDAWAGGIASAILIGAIAGLVPAIRAAGLSPTEALRTV